MSADLVQAYLVDLKDEVLLELGDNYSGEVRAPKEDELAPQLVFVTVGPLADEDAIADGGYSEGIAMTAFVNAVFEVSQTVEHYLSTFQARLAIVRAISRVNARAPSQLLCTFRGEQEFDIEGVVLSESRVQVEWHESNV